MSPVILLTLTLSAPPPVVYPAAVEPVKGEPVSVRPAGIRWRTDYDAAYSEAAKSGKPVLILYTASRGCLYCDRLARGPLKDAAVVAACEPFVCIKIDTATAAGKERADAVGVDVIPYITVHPAAGKAAAGELNAAKADAAAVVGVLAKGKGDTAARGKFGACNCQSDPCSDANCQAHGGGGNCECKKKAGVSQPEPKAAAPGVAAPATFRGPHYNPSHTCDVCGRSQYRVSGPGPTPGTHVHTCAAGHSWFH